MSIPLPFKFWIQSFGVDIRLESDDPGLVEKALSTAKTALVGNVDVISGGAGTHSFGLYSPSQREFILEIDGQEAAIRDRREHLLMYFASMLRIKVAEYAKERLFLHAGVVGWRGKAIVYPANSFGGKSTLTYEFIQAGADYYSDDYAVLDSYGMVHPFARPISLREVISADGAFNVKEVNPESLGGTIGTEPLPVGCLLITHFDKNAVWDPQFVSPGQAIIEIISQTIPIRYAPEYSLKVLKKITSNAILLRCPRNEAKEFVNRFLDFVDNTAY